MSAVAIQDSMPHIPQYLHNISNTKGLWSYVVSLSVCCPFDQSNPKDCPFSRIRLLPMKARLNWAKSLDGITMLAIYDKHMQCLAKKEQTK